MPKGLKKIKPQTRKEAYDIPEDNEKVILPSLHLNSNQVSEIKDWETGEEYHILLKIKQTSKREERDEDVEAGFDIIAYRVKNKVEDMSDDEFAEEKTKALSS